MNWHQYGNDPERWALMPNSDSIVKKDALAVMKKVEDNQWFVQVRGCEERNTMPTFEKGKQFAEYWIARTS